MHRLFGKTKKTLEETPPPSLGDASNSINSRVADLDSKIKVLEGELRAFNLQLKKATGTAAISIKRRAMETLKRKKMYESQRDQLSNQMFNIDQTSFAIDTIKNTQVTIAAMKEANKQLKIENKKIDLNEIEDMQDDLEDQLEDAGEISEILGRSYGTPYDIDEDDLEAELAGLGDELESIDVDDIMGDKNSQFNVNLPSLPNTSIQMKTSSIDEGSYVMNP